MKSFFDPVDCLKSVHTGPSDVLCLFDFVSISAKYVQKIKSNKIKCVWDEKRVCFVLFFTLHLDTCGFF